MGESTLGAGTWILVPVLYFLPSVIAAMRGHHNTGAIFMLTLLLGWTLVFWLIALVWSFTSAPPTPRAK